MDVAAFIRRNVWFVIAVLSGVGWAFYSGRQEWRDASVAEVMIIVGWGIAVVGVWALAGLSCHWLGGFFYRRLEPVREPHWSRPLALRAAGNYRESIKAYETIAGEFPGLFRPFTAMAEIAVFDLHDRELANEIRTKATTALSGAELERFETQFHSLEQVLESRLGGVGGRRKIDVSEFDMFAGPTDEL